MALHVASVAPVQRSTEGRDRRPTLDSDVRVAIEGDSLGRIAVGHHINQVGSVHGDYIVVNAAGNSPAPTPRARPIDRRGRDFPDLLGRGEEIRAVRWAARAGQPVELIAPPGMGKSVLLRHLAFRLPTLPDGVVWLSAANRPYDDLLEKLFDAFFQTSLPVKLNADDLLRHLSGINALLLVDDVDLSRDEVGALLAALPRAALVLASNERHLWGEGHAIPLGGLTLDEGMALFTRQVGRSLRPHEEGEVRRLVAFGGSPLAIRQSALTGLVVPELRIVAALAALDGAPTQLEHADSRCVPRQRCAIAATVGGARPDRTDARHYLIAKQLSRQQLSTGGWHRLAAGRARLFPLARLVDWSVCPVGLISEADQPRAVAARHRRDPHAHSLGGVRWATSRCHSPDAGDRTGVDARSAVARLERDRGTGPRRGGGGGAAGGRSLGAAPAGDTRPARGANGRGSYRARAGAGHAPGAGRSDGGGVDALPSGAPAATVTAAYDGIERLRWPGRRARRRGRAEQRRERDAGAAGLAVAARRMGCWAGGNWVARANPCRLFCHRRPTSMAEVAVVEDGHDHGHAYATAHGYRDTTAHLRPRHCPLATPTPLPTLPRCGRRSHRPRHCRPFPSTMRRWCALFSPGRQSALPRRRANPLRRSGSRLGRWAGGRHYCLVLQLGRAPLSTGAAFTHAPQPGATSHVTARAADRLGQPKAKRP
jgi:hypothetical protein